MDLFCGAGGLSYAFHRAGVHIAAAVEHDADAAESYRASFIDAYSPTTELLPMDIREARVTAALGMLRKGGGKVDLVIGGPPCQDFSPARIKARRTGRRAGLLQEYFQVIGILDPEAFLFENVPGLRTAAGGRYWSVVEEAAGKLGYAVTSAVLSAEHFGVPQRRRRLFVVGLRARHGTFSFPTGSGSPGTVMKAIGGLLKLRAGEASPTDANHRARNHTPETVKYLAQIPQGGAWRDAADYRVLACHAGHNGHYDVYGRMRGDDLAPTITGGCTSPSKGRFIHPEQDRGITVREAALLQTFPPTWTFRGGIEAQSLQVGNAVPVKLGEALAGALRRVLTGTVR